MSWIARSTDVEHAALPEGVRRSIGWALVSVVVATVAGLEAHADARPRVAPPPPPPNRKPALATYTPVQLELWAEAMIAEKRGDLDEAGSKWDSVVRSEPVANGYWNLADVKIRHGRYDEAIRALENYVKQPDADVAAGEALLQKLKEMPFKLYVSAIEAGGVLFVNGKKLTTSPATLEFDKGEYALHWIGPRGYDDMTVNAKPGKDDLRRMGGSDKEPEGGNVAIGIYGSVALSREWEYKGQTFWVDRRFDLPPGRYDIPLYEPNRACSTIAFEVPRDGMVFVFVKAERNPSRGCSDITVTTTKVKL
ncbi:MAG: tetratricopeptide repeat protein [Kofleriaceae bacterium]